MKILVVGAGSIGRRHISNLNLLGYRNIDIVDPNEEMLKHAPPRITITYILGSEPFFQIKPIKD